MLFCNNMRVTNQIVSAVLSRICGKLLHLYLVKLTEHNKQTQVTADNPHDSPLKRQCWDIE